MPSSTITRGNSLSTFYIQPSITPAAVNSYTSTVQTFSVAGLQTTDIIQAVGAVGVQTAGIVTGECDCYNTGVLSVQFVNATNAPATPISGAYIFQITRAEGSLPATAV
jgi:hypothetical protein